MTTKEAIEYWEQFNAEIDDLYDACSDIERDVLVKQREAVGFTISALRAQQELESNLKALESNEPLTGWINVKDRLPEESGRYFVADFERDYFEVLRFSSAHGVFNAFDSFSPEDANALHIKVSHWMPLPDLPKEGTR